MNISPEHRVLNEQERLLAASRLFGETLDRLDKFVPMQSTAAQTAMKKARRAAAALPEVARDTANAVKMGAAWHRREKTLKYAANTSGPVLADLTNSRVDRTKKAYGKKTLMAAGAKRGADGTPALSAAGVLLGGAGGAGSGHHAEKRARLGEGRQSDFEEETVQKLTLWCGEATSWNTKKKVIEAFKTSPMWATWTKAGHNEQKLVNFINRLKIKHLEQGHQKDNGAATAEFETEVIEKLNQWCGEISAWNVKKKVLDSFKDSAAFWSKWQAAGHSEQKLVNLINRLKIRHTEEAAKNNAAAAAALAAANGTTPPGIISAIGAAAHNG